jgi:hypothetical protein
MSTELRNFLALSYDELEELNLRAKEQRKNRVPLHEIQEERLKYLTDEKRIKAVTGLFSDLKDRLHSLYLLVSRVYLLSWDGKTTGHTRQSLCASCFPTYYVKLFSHDDHDTPTRPHPAKSRMQRGTS